ncbi:MAG: hypothetical protein AAGI22_17765 [Planctomycetota bacterium]
MEGVEGAPERESEGAADGRRVGVASLALGLGIGGLLARCHGPLFPGPLDLAGADPYEAALVRASALVLAALLVLCGGRTARDAPAILLAGVALGVGSRCLDPVDGSLLTGSAPPWVAVLPWLALAVVGATLGRGARSEAVGSTSERVALLGGLAFGAAGVAVQVEGIARIARRLGLGTEGDDAVFATVFAALVAVGGAAFGRSVPRAGRAHAAWALAIASVASVAALSIVAAIARPLGFKALCARFGADASLAGTPGVDLSVALTAFVLPALAVGAALHLARSPARLAALLVGAAVGTVAATTILTIDPGADLPSLDGLGSAGLVRRGALVAGLGLVVAAANGVAADSRVRLGATGLALAIVGVALPVTRVPVLDPWERFPVTPRAIFETAAGQFTVEPAGGDLERVTLDQRPLSPKADGLRADSMRIVRAIAAARQKDGRLPTRVLVVGLLTPERAETLQALGVETIDRTAGWWRAMRALEQRLFSGRTPPQGAVVSPHHADVEASSGAYDLVLVLPSGGRSAGSLDLGPADDPIDVVHWLDSTRPVAHLALGGSALLSTDGVESFSLARIRARDAGHAGRVDVGPPRSSPTLVGWMSVRPDERPRRAWRETAARLAAAPGAGAFERALALHAAAQRVSSPFATPAERVELDPEALELWRDDAVAREALSPLRREVVEGLAHVLEGQRDVARTFDTIEPIAAAHAPWPALERTLAWAEGEELEFEAAAARMAPLWRAEPGDVATARAYAHALVEAGEPTDAVDVLRPLSEAAPEDRPLRTQLADALVAADDPEGRRIARELLRDDPSNPLLFGLARGVRGMEALSAESEPPDDR